MDENDESSEVVESVTVVEPTPWFNADTVATSMMFAANVAQAAATHFQNLAFLALGQSAHEWVQADRAEFADEVVEDIGKLTGGGDGG